MAGGIGNSIALVKASLNVLKLDKELLIFPVMSGVASILVVGSFVTPIVFAGGEAFAPVVSEYTAPASTLTETAYIVTFHQPVNNRQVKATVLPSYPDNACCGNSVFPPGSQAFHRTFVDSDYFCRPPPLLS